MGGNSSVWIFIFGFFGFMSLMGAHIYFRFIKKLSFKKWSFLLKILFAYAFICVLLYPSTKVFYINSTTNTILNTGVGSFFLLIFISLFYDIANTILNKSQKKSNTINTQRRYALKSFLDITFIIIGVLYFFKAFASSLKQPKINKINIPLGLDGFKILQVSDLHISKTITKSFVDEMVQNINNTNPDLILLTGDIVDDNLKNIQDDIQALHNLKATYGVYMSLGNHEYYNGGVDVWIEYFKHTNITLLVNENIQIANKFNLVALSDRAGYKLNHYPPNLPLAFKDIDKNKPTIVMSHQPIMIDEIEPYKPELVVSGHTHGGQIFPFGLLVKMAQKYLSGLYQHNKDTQIFVSRGAGYWGPPIRVLADNEVNLLTL